MTLTSDNFKSLRDLVYQESGIFFPETKMYFVEPRFKERCNALNCVDTEEYLEYLKLDKSKNEMEKLVDSLTTNETYFFRDQYQIDAFVEEALPSLADKKKQSGQKTIRIWSAGCSTGEEPYTLAMALSERMKDYPGWKFQIIATDISNRVLSACRTGVYSGRSIKPVPESFKEKYFTPTDNGLKVNYDIKKMVQCSQLNFFNQTMMRTIKDIDCIFCRNVLVYFNEESAKQVINSFYDSLTPGGVIFLGYSESMHRFSGAFKMMKYKNAFAYLKD